MPGRNLNLLSLDGGGVRGLSSLYILQRIMVSIDPDNPPKPCDYFDIIGGTSTGGLIAIMLGRLEMSIDECIKAYTDLSEDVFHQKRRIPINIKGVLKERYDSKVLELAVKKILRDRKLDENALLKYPGGTKVFVCCTSGETSETSLLRTWHTMRGDPDLYNTVRIWEAARATSAASTFFDSIVIGNPGQRFLDGGTGANNPVQDLWGEAVDLLPHGESLHDNLGCLVSIGTGQPGYKPFEETVTGIGKALLGIATETETTANRFHRDRSALFENKICFRFNVPRGLGDIGLAETEQISAIKSMTSNYLQTETVQGNLRMCVQQLGERRIQQPSTRSAGMILQAIEQVTRDEDHDFYELSQDTHWHLTNNEDDSRDLLDRISMYQPQRVHCKISMQKTEGTAHWIEEDIWSWVQSSSQGHGGFGKCLWISGIVGCGKTFLANTAIQTLLDLETQELVAHFYFDSNKHDSLTTEALLRSYVKQFLRYLYGTHSEPPRPIVDAIKRIFGSRTYQVDHKQLVGKLLKPLIQSFKGSFIVVDGLDLCSPQEYKTALDCFSSLLQDTSVKVIICGRDELDVTMRLPGSVELKITHEKTKDDLALFVKQYIEERNTRDGPISNDGNTLARIKGTLIDQAEGMFLWARLQIDVLWDTCTTDDQINLALSNLPRDLDETYERCLERVEEKQQQYSLRVLRYVYEAKSPLTIDALGEALATDLDTGELKYGHIPAHTAILRSGANLVAFDEVERLVIPAHHSVRKFLDSSRAPILEELELPVLDDAVLNLGEMCIAHLIWHTSGPDIETEKHEETPDTTQLRLPSIEKMSGWIKPPSQMIPRRLSPWLTGRKDSTPSSSRSKQAPVVLTIPTTRTKTLKLYGPLHSYARSNWISLSRGIVNRQQIERLVDIDLKDSQHEHKRGDIQMFPWKSDSPEPLSSKILGWAICNGHIPLLEVGLRLKQDLLKPLDEYDGLLPLHLAARQGRVDVLINVQRRIESNASNKAYLRENTWPGPDVCLRTGRTTLHYAAERGHAEVVDLLLGSNINSNLEAVEKRDGNSRTPFHLAISSGSLATIKIMDSKCGNGFRRMVWKQNSESLLQALSAGGSLPEMAVYILRSMRIGSLQDATILKWVVKNNGVSLIPSIVKAGIPLDVDLGSNDQKPIQSPAMFFALEASTPAVATALIENGADSEVQHQLIGPKEEYLHERCATLCLIDVVLSRGWTSLASTICAYRSGSKTYGTTQFSLQVESEEVYWFSLLTVDWIITDVTCDSCVTCKLQLDMHQRFLFARYQNEKQSHLLVITMARTNLKGPALQFKIMMGTKETGISDWRYRQEAEKYPYMQRKRAIRIRSGRFSEYEKVLTFNRNPYNIQCVRILDGWPRCSSDMASWDEEAGDDVGIKWND